MSRLFAELRELTHQIEHICEETARKYDITHLAGSQGHVLVFLERNQEKEIFVKDIEKELQISKSVSSNLVKRMEKNGFIEVVPSKTDKRYKQIVLSAEGKSKIPVLQECRMDIEHYFLKGISKEDMKTVGKVIMQLRKNMKQYKGDKNA
ncbi:MarR family transcriptional regulator [Streptococcus iniae]